MKNLDGIEIMLNNVRNMNIMEDVDNWYALKVRPLNEHAVSRWITKYLGFKTLVPEIPERKLKRGKSVISMKPLVGAYVFLRGNRKAIDQRKFFLNSAIFGFIRIEGVPAAIPDDQIAGLQKLAGSGKMLHEYEYSKIPLNSRVEVLAGPLCGAVGHFMSIDKETGRFVVGVDLFRRCVMTELDSCMVRPI